MKYMNITNNTCILYYYNKNEVFNLNHYLECRMINFEINTIFNFFFIFQLFSNYSYYGINRVTLDINRVTLYTN